MKPATLCSMERITKLLPHAIRKTGMGNSVEAAEVIEAAEAILPTVFEPIMTRRMKPLYIKNRTLTISCDNTTVAQELKLREPEILHRLNQRLGKPLVDRIRYFS